MSSILSQTQSVCPICRRPLAASYIEEGGRVYFRKTCPLCGDFSVRAAPDAQKFSAWISAPVVNIPPKTALTRGREGECPLHCGTCDRHLQTACCVLLDVTDRCNRRCPWCFARAEMDGTTENDPPLPVIESWYDKLLELGEERAFNIQLSGGEPTVRDDLPEIVSMGREKGFEYIQLNTNGRRIAREEGYARLLRESGVSVAFLQFDGLREETYRVLRGDPPRGERQFAEKLNAVENCRKARLPVTLVPTLVKNVNFDEIGAMIRFMLDNLDVVKGIHFQPASFFGRHPDQVSGHKGKNASKADLQKSSEQESPERVTLFDVMKAIEEQTDGLFREEDLLPIATGHPLCCFSGSFLRQRGGRVQSLMSVEQREQGISCCCGGTDPLGVIRKDRDFVLRKWQIGSAKKNDGSCCGPSAGKAAEADGPMSLDSFLDYLESNRFTLTGMAFQDGGNLDAERLKRCRVQVLTKDERLIPFCAYNSLYRV
ncbi:MAG: radical SAM protein [Synergistaceae bacterium]|jgi:uncharacterized radical SAM superfamily Fe-S cluster-containing enzyme|nr:radical SAM protein [Synergistaceae bacterium]